jgi:hypothetical protein
VFGTIFNDCLGFGQANSVQLSGNSLGVGRIDVDLAGESQHRQGQQSDRSSFGKKSHHKLLQVSWKTEAYASREDLAARKTAVFAQKWAGVLLLIGDAVLQNRIKLYP